MLERFQGQWRFGILVGFLVLCALGGGSARPEVVSLIYLRPAAVICVAALLLAPGSWDFRGLRVLFMLLGALALLILLQLVPLPPDLWASLPGHARYAETAVATGVAPSWRPLSLTPDLTLNSLAALLIPLVVLLGFAGASEDQRQSLVVFVLGLSCLSALLGVVQLSGGDSSPAFLYAITHEGSAVGLFANRNHQATLLALSFPFLRMWTLMPVANHRQRQIRLGIAAALAVFFVAMLLVTGSRAGIAVGAVGLVLAYLAAPWRRPRVGWLSRVPRQALWVAPLALAALFILLGRALAVQRLFLLRDLAGEQRIANMPVMIQMVRDFQPFGSGFGSFDSVFRAYEPDWALQTTYFNHAHNEAVELAITGGIPALLIVLTFVVWWGVKARQAFIPFRDRSAARGLARSGAIAILLIMLASIVDYPIRTPLLAAVFTLACAWLATVGSAQAKGIEEDPQAPAS